MRVLKLNIHNAPPSSRNGSDLAEIDPRPYQAALDQAIGTLQRDQSLLDEAKTDLARYQKLATQNSIALQQVQDQGFVVRQDDGTVKLDQAAVATAKLNLAYCHITSPVAGRVGLRLVDPGNDITGTSSTGTPLTPNSNTASRRRRTPNVNAPTSKTSVRQSVTSSPLARR